METHIWPLVRLPLIRRRLLCVPVLGGEERSLVQLLRPPNYHRVVRLHVRDGRFVEGRVGLVGWRKLHSHSAEGRKRSAFLGLYRDALWRRGAMTHALMTRPVGGRLGRHRWPPCSSTRRVAIAERGWRERARPQPRVVELVRSFRHWKGVERVERREDEEEQQ